MSQVRQLTGWDEATRASSTLRDSGSRFDSSSDGSSRFGHEVKSVTPGKPSSGASGEDSPNRGQ